MRLPFPLLSLAVVTIATAVVVDAPRAQTFALESGPSYRAFPAMHVDAGAARSFARDRFGWLLAGAAGLGLYDGSHVWDFTLGLRKIERDPYQVTFSTSRTWVESGLGLHAQALWLPSPGTVGAGAGASFSLLEAQVAMLLDDSRTKYAALFVHVPVGLIVHHLRR